MVNLTNIKALIDRKITKITRYNLENDKEKNSKLLSA